MEGRFDPALLLHHSSQEGILGDTKRQATCCGTRTSVLVVGLLVALALAPVALSAAIFRTPGRAAYCGVSEGEPPQSLICWTPNDGFTISMGPRGRPRHSYQAGNKRYHEDVARVLRFGQTWRGFGYRCDSRSTGLTCMNRAGHGWWLGRYHGYRTFSVAAASCSYPAEFCAFARELEALVWKGEVNALAARTAEVTAVCPSGPEGCPAEPPGTVLRGYVGAQPGTDTLLLTRSGLLRELRQTIVPRGWRLYGLAVPRGYFARGIPSEKATWLFGPVPTLLFTAVDRKGIRRHHFFAVASVAGEWRIVETLVAWDWYYAGSPHPTLEAYYRSKEQSAVQPFDVSAWGNDGPLSRRAITRGSLAEVRLPGGCLRVHQRPSSSARQIACLAFGRIVRVDNGPTSAERARWWHLRNSGWVGGQSLRYYASWAVGAKVGAASRSTASAPGGDVLVEQASSGPVAAELSYRRDAVDGSVKDWRLRIWRDSRLVVETLVDRDVPIKGLVRLSPEPAATRSGSSLRIADLDGDGELEVIVAYWWRGTGCREGTLVWHYVVGENRYPRDAVPDHSSYRLRDLGRDGVLEFVAADCRFYGQVVSGATSTAPLRIFRWRPGGIVYVTRHFPGEVRADATRYLRLARTSAQSALVSYVADQYVLGRGAAGWNVVLGFWRQGKLDEGAFAPSPRVYMRKLCAALVRFRYAPARTSCPRVAR